jgi:SNF2 family DNA or RNA helicase
MKLTTYKPYRYQKHGEQHLLKNRYAALFLEMGLGKTVITLTAIWRLIREYMEIDRVLIVAPKKVASKVWPDEIEKWAHLQGLTYSKVLGTKRQRIRALSVKADIYIINRENFCWLVAFYGDRWPFNCVAVDESSSFKNPDSERTKAAKKVRPKTYRWINLTGTPAPNSLLDLWSQMYLLDLGERLGKTITWYRDTFFSVERYINDDIAKYKIVPGAEKKIFNEIKDICISMKTRDYIDLPPKIDNVIDVEFSKKVMDQYFAFEKEQVLKVLEEEITALTAAALSTELRQFASGFVYNEDGVAHDVHSYKIEALEEYVDVLNGKPLIVFYWFKHTKERLLKKFKKLKPLMLTCDADVDTWNRGKTRLMFLNPASAGHGLNLQFGGSTQIWHDSIWSLELVQQAEARIVRPGQKYTVINNKLKAVGTIDERIIQSNIDKEKGQNALMKATKALIKKYS